MATVKELIGEIKINQIANRLTYLRARWKDEKAYENFEDYIENIKNIIPEEGSVVQLSEQFKLVFSFRNTRIYFAFRGKSIVWGQEPNN